MLDAIRASGAPVVACEAIKKDADKLSFVAAEFKTAGRRADAGAVKALVEALGNDLRELASACAQLVADTTGTISAVTVDRYYGGRVEATGFWSPTRPSRARPARPCRCCGTHWRPAWTPCRSSRCSRSSSARSPRSPRCAAAEECRPRTWDSPLADRPCEEGPVELDPEGLAAAITAVAQADAEVKGGGRDPVFAVERAVLTIAGAHGSGR